MQSGLMRNSMEPSMTVKRKSHLVCQSATTSRAVLTAFQRHESAATSPNGRSELRAGELQASLAPRMRKASVAPASLEESIHRPARASVDWQVQVPSTAKALPPELLSVALVDASTCAGVGSMSVSWWHAEVAAGRAPQPVIRAPRCTRWTVSSVASFWSDRAAGYSGEVAAAVVAKSRRASAAAKAKRIAGRKASERVET